MKILLLSILLSLFIIPNSLIAQIENDTIKTRLVKAMFPGYEIKESNFGTPYIEISKKEFLKKGKLVHINKEYEIESYTISNAQLGFFVESFNEGAEFSNETIKILSSAAIGSNVYIMEVKVKDKEGKIIDLGTMMFKFI